MRMTRSVTPGNTLRNAALLLGTALLVLASGPALAAESAGASRSWGGFFGRTHVLLLHLPIGLLMGAFTLEALGFLKRSRGFDTAAAWLFVLGFFSSVGAVATGLLLGTEQATDKSLNAFTLLFADADQGVSDTLARHMWLGTALMVIAGVAAVLKVIAVRKQWRDKESAIPERGGLPLGLARVSLLGVMALMPFVGHLGGNMTHGQDYLTERAPSDLLVTMIQTLNAGTTEKAVDDSVIVQDDDGAEVQLVNGSVAFWNAKIQPTLNVHCTGCHNATKQNGNLRLDTLEWAMKGGTIKPGEAEFSEMYRRVILPPSHEEFMPTNVNKYGTMSHEDIIILGEWLTAFDGNIESAAAAPRVKTPEAASKSIDTASIEPVIDPSALAAINAAGGSAQSLSQEDNADKLTVKFAYLKELAPQAVAELESGADSIARLSFEGSAFGDDAAKALPSMAVLTKLNLKDSDITDAGLAELPDMPALAWLNLFGTAVTDAGLDALAKFDTLEKLYLTGTQVTDEGVDQLRQALPNTVVYSDHDEQFRFTPVVPDIAPRVPGQSTAASTAAAPINDKCPVAGAPVQPGFVSTFEGRQVAFCCAGCKAKFDAEPARFKDKLQ